MTNRLLNSDVFLLAVELGGLLTAVFLSLFSSPHSWVTRLENAFTDFASHRMRAIVGVALIVILGRLALLPVFPVPIPGVHDEYSYLLNGATFALGRLANPPNPTWRAFESFHILQRPTYVSMYPIAQGLSLAIGFLLGLPWLGVLLGVALFCSAVTWALQGWVTPQWAFVGGTLAALKFGLVSYWIDSYWGGAIAALGGALVLGAAPRLLQRAKAADAIWFSFGILILANSRPFEGLLLVVCVVAWLVWQGFKNKLIVSTRPIASIIIPASAVLLPGFAAMGLYFQATTGDPLKMPYQQYGEEYSITRPFLWENLRPEPVFHNSVMRQYYEREVPLYWRAHTVEGFTGELARKLSAFAMFYLWPGVLLVAVTLPRLLQTREGRFSLVVIGVVMAGVCFEIWPMMLHYPAPATAAAMLLLVCAIRASRQLKLGRHAVGIGLSRAVPIICAGAMLLRIAAAASGTPVPEHGIIPYLTVAPGNLTRDRIISMFTDRPGQHLILVRYGRQHDVSKEWVYNSPSIFTAHIIWARELDPTETKELIDRYPGRTVWLLQPDQAPPILRQYLRSDVDRDVPLNAAGSTGSF